MLKVNEISKTFNKGTINEKMALNKLSLELEKGECIILESCEDKASLLNYFDTFFKPDYSAQLNYGSIESGAFYSEKVDGKLIPNPNHGEQSADDFRMKNAAYGVIYLTQNEWDNHVEMEPRAKLRLERLEKAKAARAKTKKKKK